jgi:hypothetical protein
VAVDDPLFSLSLSRALALLANKGRISSNLVEEEEVFVDSDFFTGGAGGEESDSSSLSLSSSLSSSLDSSSSSSSFAGSTFSEVCLPVLRYLFW